MALSALLCPRTALAALPPASVGSSSPNAEAAAAPSQPPAKTAAPGGDELPWWDAPWLVGPRFGWYGMVGYEWAQNTFEDQKAASNGMVGTLGARFSSFLWQPWFGQFRGDVRMRVGRDNAEMVAGDQNKTMSSKNLTATGNARLTLFHRSSFPFEAHFDRDYSRTTAGDQPAMGGYLSQRFGMTQSYRGEGLDGTASWEHGTQTARFAGKTSQDTLQLTMSYKIDDISNIGASGNRSTASQKSTGQRTEQNNLTVTYNYIPDPELNIDTTANISTSDFQTNPGNSNNRLMQLNSVAFWRPEEEPLTVNASARVLGLLAESTTYNWNGVDFAPVYAEANMRTGNVNLGANYMFSPATSATASVNAGFMSVNGQRQVIYSEAAGVTHSPEEIQFGDFQYRWTTGASASHQGSNSGNQNGVQLMLQASHSLSRRYQLDNDSAFNISASQSLGYATRTNVPANVPSGSMQVTHSGSASWTKGNKKGDGATVMFSASDSRSVDGDKQFFQMLNLQLSGSIGLTANSSLSGNLSIQATRQSVFNPFLTTGFGMPNNDGDFVTTSNGSISYRNARLFGVRRLTFTTDLRMTSQALLPTLGGPLDQEMAAWDTRLEYIVGLTTLRMNTLVARTIMPNYRALIGGGEPTEPETKVNKSIMFSVTRQFGS